MPQSEPEPLPGDVKAPGWNASQWALLDTPAPSSAAWQPVIWPGKTNLPFRPDRLQGRPALRVDANRSMSMLRQRMGPDGVDVAELDFSWAVSRVHDKADIGVAGLDDAPVRIVLAFDGDRSKLSGKARMQSELARALMGEEMPYATLTYIWCNKRPVGTVLVSPRTDRVRKLVVESGPAHVGQWREYHRNVREDFERAFGEAPGKLIGIAFMTDGDNTGEKLTAWYGALRLSALHP
jgi:hypothetical protein